MEVGDKFIVKTRVFEVEGGFSLKKDDVILVQKTCMIDGEEHLLLYNSWIKEFCASRQEFEIHCKKEDTHREMFSSARCKTCGIKTVWGGTVTGTRKFYCKNCKETTESIFYKTISR